MNTLLETIFLNGLMLDSLGLIGLGLLGFSAITLARRYQSWGGTLMAIGAICLLFGRLYSIFAPHLLSEDLLVAAGPIGFALTMALPPLLLTFGLAGIVWGLWGHERWVQEETR